MIVKKYLVIILVFFIGWTLWAEQIIDTGVFIHDKTVNNAFIGQYTLGDDPDIFSDFFAIDTASYQQGGFVYGIGVDKYKNLFYYFDFNKKSEYFGVDLDTGERALKLVDKVATTKSGKFYAIDCITEEIYYWDINRNKGTELVVYAVGKNDQLFHLANFDKNFPDGESASENKPYHVSYNSSYFNVSSRLGINGYNLRTDVDGNMAFYHGDSSTTNSTVKALS